MSLQTVAQHITPFSVLDIGANRGHWTAEAKQLWPNAYFMLIEGNLECDPILSATGLSYRIALLSDTEKEVTFYTRLNAPACTGASYYRETTQFYEGDNAIPHTRQTDTLDRLFPDDTFDLIKIDVQGAELDVLKGGTNLVSRAKALLLECAVSNYNDGAPTVVQILDYCRTIGFKRNVHIEDIPHPVTRQIVQQDILFLR
jgi:FkbM family methyltransferase